MTAGGDLNRMLWAVGEARRLRRAESLQSAAGEPRSSEGEEFSVDQPAGHPPD